jgi:glycosyltransferase involved in cell wall biosynthesis
MPENRTIYWIADFQDRHMPELFSERELEMRRRKQSFIASRRAHIIFSSETALHDFTTFYPEYCCQTYVVPFTVTHPSLEGIIQEDLVKKYDLSPRYFFLPNQFWKHKNHILVLQALKIMQERGLTTQVVFTGKEEDYRNPEHFTSLQNYVKENQLFDHVRFLGFIDRAEQLVLMKNSFAVIQPSLFEGWSTVVEDAKALNCFVLLSDIPVHREQMKENARFFSPYDAEGLAKLMSEVWENPPHVSHTPYDCGRFGQLFYSVLRRAESRL